MLKWGGEEAVRQKKGIHGLSPEEKIETGMMTVRAKLGIHAQNKDELSEAGKLRALSIGRLPWFGYNYLPGTRIDEGTYCLILMTKPEYQHQYGSFVGSPEAEKIAAELNKVFHNGDAMRNDVAIRNFIYRQRKKLNS